MIFQGLYWKLFLHLQSNMINNEKKELYRQQEIDEYWILDGEKRKIEIYTLDYDQDGKPQYYLFNTVTEQNKDKLFIVHFPHIKMCFDELFDVFSRLMQ